MHECCEVTTLIPELVFESEIELGRHLGGKMAVVY